jgi:adenylosuccinate lyase
MSREHAYRVVQQNATEAWEGRGAFQDLLSQDKEVSCRLSREEIADLFEAGYHTRHVDTIFKRVFGDDQG